MGRRDRSRWSLKSCCCSSWKNCCRLDRETACWEPQPELAAAHHRDTGTVSLGWRQACRMGPGLDRQDTETAGTVRSPVPGTRCSPSDRSSTPASREQLAPGRRAYKPEVRDWRQREPGSMSGATYPILQPGCYGSLTAARYARVEASVARGEYCGIWVGDSVVDDSCRGLLHDAPDTKRRAGVRIRWPAISEKGSG